MVHERTAKKKEESPADKAGRVTATATKWMAIFTFMLMLFTGGTLLILKSQLREMHEGGVDTRNLALAAQAQAAQMKIDSSQTDQLINETHTLATNAGAQATNAANEVKKLGALVEATNKQVAATKEHAIATTGQLAIMQKQLEAADRPWVKADVQITSPLGPPREPQVDLVAMVQYTIRTTNAGRSPAQISGVIAKLFPGVDMAKWRRWQNIECSINRGAAFGITGYTLFPGVSEVQAGYARLDVGDLDLYRSSGRSPDISPNMVPIAMVGCVSYTFESSPLPHQTGFAVQLWPQQGLAIDITQLPIPKESITLRGLLTGTFAN